MTDDDLDDDYEDDDYDDEVGAEGNRIVGARARGGRRARHPQPRRRSRRDRGRGRGARGGEVALLVHANPDDMGRLIGRAVV